MQKIKQTAFITDNGKFIQCCDQQIDDCNDAEDEDQHTEESYLRDLTIKAQRVVLLAKPVPNTISSTFNSYISEILKKFQVDAKLQTAFITRATSHSLYHNTGYFIKQVQTVPMELAVQINGLKFLFNTLVKSLTGVTTLEKLLFVMKFPLILEHLLK